MRFQFVKPSGILGNFIRYYCFMESAPHEEPVRERVIPTENIQLMFHYKNPFVVCHPNERTTTQPYSILSGLSHSYADVSTWGEAGVIFINFHSVGACRFFNFPLSEIENQNVDLNDIFSYEIKQIEEKLYLTDSMADRIRIIERFLLKNYSPISSYDDQLIRAGIDLIKRSRGQINAKELSQRLSVTSKNLERKFSQHIGKTPQQLIKLIRFQNTILDVSTNRHMNLTECAYRNGYFDQSHFIHDFKTYSGYTPGEFLKLYPDCDNNIDFNHS